VRRKTLALAAAALACATLGGPVLAAVCVPATCQNPALTPVPDVTIVYYGATAVGPSIVQAGQSLYGTAIKDCNNNVRTYRACRDLDGAPGLDTCVQFMVGQNLGSCEGVQALDRKENAFNVCDPAGVGGTAGRILLSNYNSATGQNLYANFSGSDVNYTLCEPVVSGGAVQRSAVFDSTEATPFVTPFAFVVNRNIETVLPAAKKPSPANCPYGAGDCVKLDLNMTKAEGKGLWGNNNLCDWRWIDPDITNTNPLTVGSVMRNRLSGTRRNFNVTILDNLNPGLGTIYVAGSGDMVSAVNTNKWCGNDPTRCGENQSTGQTGIGAVSPSCNASAQVISVGVLGTDRINISDNNTPADPFDDFGYRNNVADNYDVLKYDGQTFNKVNVRCGRYDNWTFERLYYDNDTNPPFGYFFPAGSLKESAVLELINQTGVDAVTDPNVVASTQMLVSRAKDGAPVFPSSPYNTTLCSKP
jgi:hypothetical protein